MIAMLMVVAAVLLLALAARGGIRLRPPSRPVLPPPPPRPARAPVRADVPHLLYAYEWEVPTGSRHPECYIGISNDPPARDGRHAIEPKDQDWYQRSTKVMVPVRWYPNRAEARAAERDMVRQLSASGAYLANDHYNVRRPARAQHR